LTPGEWRVVHAVKHGLTSREIAARRGISVDAVKFHVANALAKLGLANRRALRHWHQMPLGTETLMETTQRATTHDLGPIGQIARSVSDIAAAESWYGTVLGLKHLYTFGTLAFFDLGGTRLMLTQEGGSALHESVLYLRVGDIGKTYEELQGRGVEFINAPHRIHRHPDGTEEWMAFFKDPDDRTLAIMAQVKT
jgi:DNA-binding CsgD family transcriptional regulator/catechol 2,3-dioxygenase-like lactoylglutathione lyase family enzyme